MRSAIRPRQMRRFCAPAADILPEEIDPEKEVRTYAQRRATSKSLQELYDETVELSDDNFLKISKFVWTELPIRISHRITELSNLPYNLSTMPSIRHVRQMYIESFMQLITEFKEPQNQEDAESFQHFVNEHSNQMSNVISTIAQGIREMKIHSGMTEQQMHECPFINDFLDRFFLSRVGTRVLTSHYCALDKNDQDPGCVGIIDNNISPKKIVQRAVRDASELCTRHYGSAPEVIIRDDHNITFKYLGGHLQHMVFELLKNSMRATCEHHPGSFDDEMPPITIVLVPGNQEITIKISDEGGGIQRDSMDKIWLYSYTTAGDGAQAKLTSSVGDQPSSPVFAGYGYGLPLSRLYARYFGGDLKIVSMEGYGTDAYLYLSVLGDTAEPLPYPFDNPGIYLQTAYSRATKMGSLD